MTEHNLSGEEIISTPEPAAEMPAPKASVWPRVLLLVGVLAALWLLGRWLGMDALAKPKAIREIVTNGGPWGIAIFIGLWLLLYHMMLPSGIFLFAALILFGPLQGALIAWGGGMFVLAFTHVFTRWIGGVPIQESNRPMIQQMLSRLEKRPIKTIATVRSVLFLSPPVNYAVILSGVPFRTHMIASAIGITPCILFCVVLLVIFQERFLALVGF